MSKHSMSKRLKKKTLLVIVIEIICLVAFGCFLTAMQKNLAANSQKTELLKKSEPLAETVATAEEEAADTTDSYDSMYVSKANSLAYLVQQKVDTKLSDSLLEEYRELLNVTNALILDNEGNILYQAQKSPADFTRSRYNQLRVVFETGEGSEPFEVDKDGETRRYYGAKIDGDSMAVIEQDPQELVNLLDNISTWESMLRNVSVGATGYAFAVSGRDYTFLYHPQEDVTGTDALDAGIDVTDLENGTFKWMTINGERLLCSVSAIGENYVICAIPEKEIESSCTVTVWVVLFVFFMIVTLILVYGIFTLNDHEQNEELVRKNYKKIGGLYYNKVVGRKIGIISAIGVICILVASLYMQTLFALSRQSMSNNQHVAEVQSTITRYEQEIENLEEQYNTRYLNKARTAAYILENKPELQEREELAKLSKVLDVEHISIFNEQGTIIATNSNYMNFTLSEDEGDQSYEFRKLLSGADYVVQEAQPDEALGIYSQYIGVAFRDESGLATGFVQICVNPQKLEDASKGLSISSVLDGIQVGSDGFSFAINKDDDYTFAYYPEEKYIGRPAADYGIKDTQISDGFSDYIKIGKQKYYASCLETEDYFVYVAVPVSEIATTRIPVALLSTAVGLVCLLITGLILSFQGSGFWKSYNKEREDRQRMFDTEMPDGSIKKTEAASSRWSNVTIGWNEKAPEQKMAVVFKILMTIVAFGVLLAWVFREQLFSSDSMFRYIMGGTWQRGFNIFAVTGCILVICCVIAVTGVIQKVLQLLSQALSAKGETLCRLLSNFVKYATLIILLYYCLAMFGVDTATLLASAGIVGLMISLGAQKLVADILAGLFIIFEGEFRVGDIVTIGDCRGTVVEIGVRTTKILDGGNNIKVINNSAISGVVNMTKKYSIASWEFGFSADIPLDKIEEILNEELPKFKKHISAIHGGPYYRGVTSVGGGVIKIAIDAECRENDRAKLIRDMNREFKLMFDKYEISIK